MSGSIRRAQKIRPEHASVTQKITRKHQNMVICTMKIEHAEFQQTCQRMLASASNRLRMHYPTCICKHGPRVSQTPHALSMRARGTGHGAWRGKISSEQWGNRCIMQVGCIQVYLNSHGCISGAASPVSASRHRGLRVTPAMAVPALKSSRKPATKAQAPQTHHEAWIQHSRVHAMICYSVIRAQSNN